MPLPLLVPISLEAAHPTSPCLVLLRLVRGLLWTVAPLSPVLGGPEASADQNWTQSY